MQNTEYKKIIEGISFSYDIAGQNYYDLFHDDIMQYPFDQSLLREFTLSFQSKPIICDMGCGPAAQYAAYIAPKCKEVHGVDVSDKNIKIAQSHHRNMIFTQNDMMQTDYSDEYFDGIISFYSLFHIPKP